MTLLDRPLVRALIDAVVSRPVAAAGRSMRRAIILTLPIPLLAAFVFPDLISSTPPFPPDFHLHMSIDQAVNAALCGCYGCLSSRFEIGGYLTSHPEALSRALASIADDQAGSRAKYCRTVDTRSLNNENSLMWVMVAGLRGVEGLSTKNLGRILSGLRILGVYLAGCVLAYSGVGIVAVFGLALAAFAALRALIPYQYSMYPFNAVIPLVLIAGYSALLTQRPSTRGMSSAAWLFAVGAVTAFSANMRTSHAPIYAGLAAIAWVLDTRAIATGDVRGAAWRSTMTWFASLLAGYAVVQWLLIVPLRPPADAHALSYHSVAHPLVLGLALPESELSRREGIEWNDEAGVKIARRIDPSAIYLSREYERALFRYYARLWATEPRDMLAVYVTKFRVATSGVFETAAAILATAHIPTRLFRWVGNQLNGLARLVLVLVALLWSGWMYRRQPRPLFAVGALASWSAACMIVESAAIMPTFQIFYDGWLLIYLLALPAIVLQLAADAAASR